MKSCLIYGLIGTVFIISVAFITKNDTPEYIDIPKNWPKPIYDFKNNPLSKEGFELGRQLFYDPILSKDNTISCASCHLQATGFTHVDHSLSHGFNNTLTTRNAPPLFNLAWQKEFHHDGGIFSTTRP